MVTLTVFTPTYQRAHTLPRTYQSLLAQDHKDFLWLIVDDGSTDGTRQLVETWLTADNGFEIRYVYKENGGMHTAHRVAYENIDTELNICIDSDDLLAPGAVRKILEKWEQARDAGYAGLVGLDSDLEGNIIGTRFPAGLEETTLTGFYAAGGSGDKKLVYRTDIVRRYPPYPSFQGERYVALAYLYRLIDQDYQLCVIDDVLCNVEYQPDGSSLNMFRQYLQNPQGFAFWRVTQAQTPTSSAELLKNTIHYCSSKILAKRNGFTVAPYPYPVLAALCTPLGYLLTLYIKRKASKLV